MGDVVLNWIHRFHPLFNPQYHTFQGQYCRLELFNSKTNDNIIQQLYDAFKPTEKIHFEYLKYSPFKTIDGFKQFVHIKEQPTSDTVWYDMLGYRNVEWRCDALNTKLRQAAIRLGFQYEGTWLKAEVRKGRSRDSSWYVIVDDEWPQVKGELQRWLNLENFDTNGKWSPNRLNFGGCKKVFWGTVFKKNRFSRLLILCFLLCA